MFMGMTEMMVMKLFRDARGLARKYAEKGKRGACIVFMDEIDSIGLSRGGKQGGAGMGMGMGCMFGGATASTRCSTRWTRSASSSRTACSRKILRWLGHHPRPRHEQAAGLRDRRDQPARSARCGADPTRPPRPLAGGLPARRRGPARHHPALPAQKAHDPSIDIEMMVADSIGWTPITIKTIINEALINAHDDGREYLTYKDWLAAGDERSLGLKQPIREMLAEDKRALAYHEAGHAVAALLPAAREPRPEGVDHPVRRRPRRRPAVRARGAPHPPRAPDRDRHHGLAGLPRRGGGHPRHEDGRRLVRPCERQPARAVLLRGPRHGLVAAGRADEHGDGLPDAGRAHGRLALAILMDETKRLMQEKEYAVHAVAEALLEHGELIGDELEDVFR